MWQRHGKAEVELLRRFGQAPAGTRTWASFVLTQKLQRESNGQAVGIYTWDLCLDVPGGSRRFEISAISFAHPLAGLPRDTKTHFRGKTMDTFGWDVFQSTLVAVTEAIESEQTRSGHSRFRVVHIEWTEPPPEAEDQT
jgi:hypothetical protein